MQVNKKTLIIMTLLSTSLFAESFQGLGVSGAGKISDDGKKIVGTIRNNGEKSTFLWNDGNIEYYTYIRTPHISADGSVIFGTSDADPPFLASLYKLVDGSIQILTGNTVCMDITGVSDDGSIVTGYSRISTSVDSPYFAWSYQNGVYNNLVLPSYYDLATNSITTAISNDGSIVTGYLSANHNLSPPNVPLYWNNGLPTILDILPDYTGGRAWEISGDGSTIVGYSNKVINNTTITQAVLWRNDQVVSMGTYESTLNTIATIVSGDGSIIFGESSPDIFRYEREAWIWDEVNGMRPLMDYFHSVGVDTADWTVTSVYDVSADMKTIIGMGINPTGQYELWIATIPEPATALLFTLGVLLIKKRKV